MCGARTDLYWYWTLARDELHIGLIVIIAMKHKEHVPTARDIKSVFNHPIFFYLRGKKQLITNYHHPADTWPIVHCSVHSCMTKSISTWFSLQTWIFPNIFSCPQHWALVVAVLTMSLILLFCPLLTPCDFQYLRPLLKQLLMRARSWVLTVDITAPSPVTNKRRADPGSKLNRPLICEPTFQFQVMFGDMNDVCFIRAVLLFSDVFYRTYRWLTRWADVNFNR